MIPRKPLNIWLKEKVNDKYITNKYIPDKQFTPPPQLNNNILCYDKVLYLKHDDIDIKYQDECYRDILLYSLDKDLEEDGLLEAKSYLESYCCDRQCNDDLTIFIPPNTKHYHASYLYKQILDSNSNYNMYEIINPMQNINYQVEKPNYIKFDIFDLKFKKDFYKFCMKYTL